ncbi:MAG TPA: FAD-dependent oxidoreductase [Clostridia bacterium]
MEEIKSIWHSDDYPTYPKLESDIDVDTLIIGGGLSGISAAYYLSRNGIKCAVIEANKIGSGTTKNTTAHITSQHDLTYDRYINQFGQIKTSIIAKANQEAIDEIENIIKTENIDCDFERVDSYLFTTKPENSIQLRKEYNAVKNTAIKAFLTTQSGLVPFVYDLALGFENQAMFHPMKYLHGLAQCCLNNKVKIYEDTKALDFKERHVYTSNGFKISANNIVIATNFPIINFPGWYFIRVYQHRSYNGAYQVSKNITGMWNCIDQEGYTYRKYQELAIVSGQGHQCGYETDVPHYHKLKNHAEKIFPKAVEVARWSAQDCITPDNLPLIGFYSKKERNMFVMTGFNKWGMTSTNIAGRIIGDLIAGNNNAYSQIYDPLRKMSLGVIGKAIWSNMKMVGSLIGGLNHLSNPVCTHLKCRTVYNPEEQTWDCPCHGSRFDKLGNVINSPAIKRLDETPTNPNE